MKSFWIVLLSIAILAALPGAGRAELLGKTLKPFVSLSESYDSNVFKVKNQAQLDNLTGKGEMGDFITVTSLGTGVHYKVSNQELDLLLEKDFILYSSYSDQNSQRDIASGKLTLSVLDRLQLLIDGSYLKAPESRADYQNSEQNDKTQAGGGVSLGFVTTSGVGIEAGYRKTTVDYSLSSYRANEYAQERYAGTLFYQPSADSKIYASLQRENTDYRVRTGIGGVPVDNDSVSDSFRLGLDKAVSPRTAVSAYLGYLERKHEQASSRDFSGVIARVEGRYGLTAKLGLMLSAERELYEETYADWNYSVNDSVGLGLSYQLSAKLKASLFERQSWKKFKEVPGGLSREDSFQQFGTGLEWTPLLRLGVHLGYQYAMRDSSDDISGFSAHTVTSSVNYRF